MIGTFWHGLNAIKSGASRPAEVAKWQAKKVGVLGAGMMGAGLPTQPQSKAFLSYSKMCL
jgi:3-hydroxyacyl-CoA dehydrogenase/enoyl-CoA hydratase/3-hydroxybutyryl-CoA epimerase